MTEQNQRSSLLGKIAAYTEILAKDPKSTIFVSLGEAYRKMGMLDDARQVIEQGMNFHNEFSPACIVQARILCQQGDYQASEAAFDKALALDNESLAALVGYARLNILLGREAKASELLLTARKLSPADPVINKLLLSLPGEEKPVEEQVDTGETEEVVQPPLASATLAELYLKQGLDQQALDIYRQLSNEDPNNLVLRRQIRDLEEKLYGAGEETGIIEEGEDVVTTESEQELNSAEGVNGTESSVSLVSSESAAVDIDDTGRVLNVLNRWLDSIQQRRSDV